MLLLSQSCHLMHLNNQQMLIILSSQGYYKISRILWFFSFLRNVYWDCYAPITKNMWNKIKQYFVKFKTIYILCGLPWWCGGKESTCQCRRYGFSLWIGKLPWRRKWRPTTVFLPGKSHGQRRLVGYSPWSHKRVRHLSN